MIRHGSLSEPRGTLTSMSLWARPYLFRALAEIAETA
jgi:hypothetical protein